MSIATSTISGDQYQSVLDQHETHFVDLKAIEIAPASLTKTVSAFANASGGEIYIGIDELLGVNGPERLWRGFDRPEAANGIIQVLEAMSPLANHYEATFLRYPDASSIVLHLTIFKSRDILFASNDKAYIRRGAQKLPLDDAALQRLKYDKGITSFEDELLDIEVSTVSNSLVTLEFLLRVVPSAEPLPWLKSQRLVVNDRATVAAALLLSEDPQATLPKRSAIKLLRYKTKSDGERDFLAFDPVTVEGPAYELIYGAVDKAKEILEDIEKLGVSGLEKIAYPEEALHEIITNAVLHRDYSIPSDIQVRIFDNRVEIESPGRLPGHVTPKNILTEQFARNPKLVRLINKFPDPPNKDVGEGMNTAFEAMEKLGCALKLL